MLVGFVMGLLQGVFEWIPVSSEGVVSYAYATFFDKPLAEAVYFALWLHVGTTVAALVAFRRDLYGLLIEALGRRATTEVSVAGGESAALVATAPGAAPPRFSPFFRFLVVATIASGLVGFPLLKGLEVASSRFGGAAMLVIGVAMLFTGSLQLRRPAAGTRSRSELTWKDGLLTGIAQGLAVVPGLSRSGLTVGMLLGLRIDRKEALALSFMMSIPVALGAALYTGMESGYLVSFEAILAAVVAGIVGFATLRLLISMAERVNFGLFVLLVGISIIAGGLWEVLGR